MVRVMEPFPLASATFSIPSFVYCPVRYTCPVVSPLKETRTFAVGAACPWVADTETLAGDTDIETVEAPLPVLLPLSVLVPLPLPLLPPPPQPAARRASTPTIVNVTI